MKKESVYASRALVSISAKNSSVILTLNKLASMEIEIYASKGTYNFMKKNRIQGISLEHCMYTQNILDGRIKTIHPLVFASVLADPSQQKHQEDIKSFGIKNMQILFVTLYPFKKLLKEKSEKKELIENIDIGGHALIRAGIKNFYNIAVCTDNDDLEYIIKEMAENSQNISYETRKKLAKKAMNKVIEHDMNISKWMHEDTKTQSYISLERGENLKYGENPHQETKKFNIISSSFLSEDRRLQKLTLVNEEHLLSYNNYLDIQRIIDTFQEFDFKKEYVAMITKHAIPCSVSRKTIKTKKEQNTHDLFLCNKEASFGGVVGLNYPLDFKSLEILKNHFIQGIVVPSISSCLEDNALKMIKPFIAIIPEINHYTVMNVEQYTYNSCLESFFVHKKPRTESSFLGTFHTVSKNQCSKHTLDSLHFAWKIVKHVRSNAVVIADGDRTYGIGSGQLSRISAMKTAIDQWKCNGKNKDVVCASDGFFPFKDSVEEALNNGIKAFIQPGGSKKDSEIIELIDTNNATIIFTGRRVFSH